MNRRRFLSTAAGISAAGLAGMSGISTGYAASGGNIKNIGIQLYTIRKMMAENMEASLARVAEVGYKEVEFFDYYGRKASDVKGMLNQNGLVSPSIHVDLAELYGDELKKLIDYSSELDQKYITLAWFQEADRQTLDQFKSYVDLFHHVGGECKKAGITFAYHNHEFEFQPIDGVEPYDLFLENVPTDLLTMEMDLYWITSAGRNPLEYFKKHPGRFHMCHIKDRSAAGEMVDVGDGILDFNKFLSKASDAGFEHFFAEHDQPADEEKMMVTSYNSMKNFKLG